ncbi:MAG: hypothetical protein R2844_02545 [Caldilineales bacterium]
MDENTLTVSVVYQGGVFVPEQDVSFLDEGARLDLHVPAPPDEWDQLLEELVAQEAAVRAIGLPEPLDWMGGGVAGFPGEDANRVIDVDRLLGWSDSAQRGSALLL